MVRIEEPVSVRLPRVVVESAPVPLPKSTVPAWMFPQPVPPKLTARVVVPETAPLPLVTRSELVVLVTVREGVERAPVLLMEVVPVCPKDAMFERWFVVKKLVVVAEVAVAFVAVSPPLKLRSVVVALLGNK